MLDEGDEDDVELGCDAELDDGLDDELDDGLDEELDELLEELDELLEDELDDELCDELLDDCVGGVTQPDVKIISSVIAANPEPRAKLFILLFLSL